MYSVCFLIFHFLFCVYALHRTNRPKISFLKKAYLSYIHTYFHKHNWGYHWYSASYCSLSVLNGFFDVVQGYLLNYDPDLRVEASGSSTFVQNQELVDQINSLPEITLLSPYVEGKALLTNNGKEK